ncbi:tetratricopeptide repeat protein [Polaromonas sp. C04]|uniref:tetratricopeptide repeat protein n=1 Tax=Polaromonas sp. C04 TaxID=1945857 RepID=UPI0009874623|nr:tetratricopeptide repeat protein [Polaromonas sp. C04]OOG51174.1 hypothetical protein B0E49_16245 [Polaromonas sp. C04]
MVKRVVIDGRPKGAAQIRPNLFAVERERILVLVLVLFVGMMRAAPAHSQVNPIGGCGQLANHYGPYDYRTQRDKLAIVDQFHFTPEVEALIKGNTSSIGGDLGYTLRTSPNHLRALMSMARLAERLKTPEIPDMHYSVECYFIRAIQFAPDDTLVRIVYAQYLAKTNKTNAALKELQEADFYAKDNGFSHYNIGLEYFDLKQYDKARVQAHKALQLGFNGTALTDKLKSVNQWKEPDISNPPNIAK